ISVGASASTSIFQGLLKYHSLKKSQIDLLATKQEVAKFKNDISLNIALYYLEIIYNKELIVTLEKQIESSKTNIERMSKLVDAGTATKGELLDMQAQMSNEEYSLVDGQNRLRTSILNICQLLELKELENFDVVVPDISDLANIFPQENVETIYNIALSLPEIEGAKYRFQSASRGIKIAQSRLYPSLNANFGYNSAYSDSRTLPVTTPAGVQYEKYKFWSQLKDNKGSSLSISLNIPILNQLSARNNVKIARFNAQKAEYNLRNAEIKLYKDIEQAHSDAIGAMKKFDAALARVRANEESISYTESKLSAGSVTVTDYNVAKNNLMIAQAQMLQAKYDYVFKVQVLEFYKGIPIGMLF
ncbi:MAG: TolC family protein, partial [Rikenellaceae bacterium]